MMTDRPDRFDDDENPRGPEEDMSPLEQAVLEALFSEPFPLTPYALIPIESNPVATTVGGGRSPEFVDYLIHKDIATENQCVFVFDSIVDAFAVAQEYKDATGKEAEPVECDVFSLEDRFWVKYYRSNGVVVMMPVLEYREHIGTRRSYD